VNCVRWGLASVVLAGLLSAAPASAHEARPAYLEVKEIAPGQFGLLWRTPVLAGMRLPVAMKLPDDLRNLKEPVVEELADSLVERRWIDASPDGLAGRRIEFPGLQLTITDALVRVQMLNGRTWTTIVHPSQAWFEIAALHPPLAVMTAYVARGIQQIAFGVEHLLLLLGLVRIVKDRWMLLLKTVTAFALAHSVTLVLATFGWVNVPALPLNAAIALSVLFLGPDIVRSWRGEASLTIEKPWIAALVFGSLLGFGFASALSGVGLPRAELPLALLSFNLGLEIGQVAFVLLIVLLQHLLQQLEISWPRWVEALPAYMVGSLGAFWTMQRTALLLSLG